MKKWIYIISICYILFALGCSSLKSNSIILAEHPDPKVSYPAMCGVAVGFVAGIPLDIVLFPVCASMSKKDPGPHGIGEVTWLFMPSLVTGVIVGDIVGFLPWLAFGWWGNEK